MEKEKGFVMLNYKVRKPTLYPQGKDEYNLVEYSSAALSQKEIKKLKEAERLYDLVQKGIVTPSTKHSRKLAPRLASTYNELNEDEAALLLKDYKELKCVPNVPRLKNDFEEFAHPSEQVVHDDFFGKYYVVPRESDLRFIKATSDDESNELFTRWSESSLLSKVDSLLNKEQLNISEHELQGEESYEPLSTYDWYINRSGHVNKLGKLKLDPKMFKESVENVCDADQVKFLRTGPSCPELVDTARHIINNDDIMETHLESAHLDYALIMNMFEGHWGVDEDQTIAQITFKYIHDESFRKRLTNECHSLIDECDCPLHKNRTTDMLMNLQDSSFFEIETEEDKVEVIDRLRKEYRDRYEDEMNMDMERVLNPGPDSDDDDDYYQGEPKKPEPKELDIIDFDEPKEWLNIQQPKREVEPQCPDKFISEEDFLPSLKDPTRPQKVKVKQLRMRDMVKMRDRKNVQELVEKMYKDKVQEVRINEFKNIKWRPKKAYAYKRPNWNILDPKKRESTTEPSIQE